MKERADLWRDLEDDWARTELVDGRDVYEGRASAPKMTDAVASERGLG